MMTGGQITCPCCHRLVQARRDGRVRAHLGTRGRRGACEGSGRLSVHVEMAMTEAEGRRAQAHQAAPQDDLTDAERFNAADAWGLVDALYTELEAMRAAHAASVRAVADAEDALDRAWQTAQALAPWQLYASPQGGADG
jgi:hypothetical protein